MKKLFSVIMCVLMVMCFMPTTAFAEGDSEPSAGSDTKLETSVASIETTTDGVTATKYYDTLDAAFTAAKASDTAKTVKLVKDYTASEAANECKVYDITGLTFDLAGFTYSCNNFSNVFQGTGGKITNGSMISLSSGSYALFVGDEGETNGFTVENVVCTGGINVYHASNVVLKNVTAKGPNYYAVWADYYANVVIESGDYSSDGVAVLGLAAANAPSVKVTGGNFKVKSGQNLVLKDGKVNYGTPSIEGGTFNTDPTAYLAEGKTVVASGDSKYPYEVESKTEHVEVAKTAEAKVESDVKIDESKTDAEKEAITNEVELVSNTIKETSITGLEVAAATEAAKDEEAQDIEKAKEALKEAGIDDQTTVNVFVQPYLDIKIADASFDIAGDTEVVAMVTELTLNIVPMVKTIATTATKAEDIVTTSGDNKTKNAVEIEDAKEIKVTTPVTITIPLPEGFVSGKDTPLYIKHTKDNRASYVYTATVTSKEVNEKTSFYATFTNPNGFSEFLMTKQNISVAKIGEVGYTTLQDAVNAVKDGETITLTQDAGSATVNRTVSFNVEKGDFTYEIKIGGNSKNSGTDDSYEVVYTAPRHSSSSKSSTVDKTEDPTKDTGAVDEKDSKTTATELANALSFKARSSKTAKGNIKVNLTVPMTKSRQSRSSATL